MARTEEDKESGGITKPQPTEIPELQDESDHLAAAESAELTEIDQEEEKKEGDEGKEGEDGSMQGEADGGGGGVGFDETEHEFDATELQGLSLPIFRRALKKGLKLVSRVTKQSEQYLRNFLPDKALRSRVLEVALSEKGYPTLLLDKGEIVQYQINLGKLDRVRVSPDLDAERAVKYAMAGFIAAGESIDPKDVKFGRSPEFEARMKPIWVREWRRMQQDDFDLHMDAPRKDASFRQAVQSQSPTRSAPATAAPQASGSGAARPLIDIPRGGRFSSDEPQM